MKAKTLSVAVATVAVSSVLAACGSSGSSSTASGAKASKSPIEIGVAADIDAPSIGGGEPQIVQAAEAAAKAVNAAGGINGRPLRLVTCDEKGDPNTALACARSLAGNKNIVAVVGSTSATTPLEPVLQPAGLADFGDFPIASADLSSPVSFPIVAGGDLQVEGLALLSSTLKPKGDKISFAYAQVAAFGAQSKVLAKAAAAKGLKLTKVVPIPLTTADLSSIVAASASGSGVITLGATPALEERFITTVKQSGVTVPLVLGAAIDPAQLKTLGAAANGVYVVDSVRAPSTAFAGGRQFLAETKYLGSSFAVDETSVNAWMAVHIFATVAAGMKTIDRSAFLAKASTLKNVSTYGFTASLTTTKTWSGFGGQAPRVFNHYVVFEKIENGTYDPIGNPVSVP